MPVERKKVEVRFEREIHGDDTFDILYIDNKEIASFHVDNIDALNLEHTPATITQFISDYFKNSKSHAGN